MKYHYLLISFILTACSIPLVSQQAVNQPVRFMFYNVENFFDTSDDPGTDDNEFLPSGLRRWSFARYDRKKNSIAKVIVAAGEWEPPALVGLCEVENRRVLTDLAGETFLSGYMYDIIHEESYDPRGIDVALLYRKDVVTLLAYRYIIPDGYNRDTFFSRGILYSKFLVKDDTLHLFVNHWPSRRGGTLPGQSLRMELAGVTSRIIDSISGINPGHSKILIAGDFNSTPSDGEVMLLTPVMKDASGARSVVNLSASLSEQGKGTYRYLGVWEMIDQVMVSSDLINAGPGLFVEKEGMRIFDEDFLLKRDTKYPGKTPMSTYYGYRYQGGFSDHLPVLIDLYYH